ncbi:MAG: hypothetical protein HRT64_04010 [Erythrobacter sp.]|nr:hypothetical protein [Erythrobacter sp.]
MTHAMKTTLVIGSAIGALALVPQAAMAQEVNLNYDRLSSLEEPIAFDLGEITVEVSGLADVPVVAEFNSHTQDDDIDPGFVGNIQVSASTQLKNRWRVGVAYFAQYATDDAAVLDAPEDYSDNVAGFIGTSFGTVLGGNVNGQVREITRRQRGVGNGFLAFDNFYGELDNWGGSYVGRFGPSVLGAVVDENGDFEMGAVFQRPIGQKDYRFSARYRHSRFVAADGITEFDSDGVGAVGELVYGSTIFDVGAGYERLESVITDLDRLFLSAGAQTQLGPLRLSGEAHYGRAGGHDETSAALGLSYDLARGLLLNLGFNYEDAAIESGGVALVETDEVTAIASVRFSF